MQIKKILFALPVAAAAIFFTFCAKEPLAPVAEAQLNNGAVGERAKCLVTVTVNTGTVDVCGTGNMLTACGTVGAVTLYGNEQVAAPLSRVYGVSVPTGGQGFIRLTTVGGAATVTVTTSGGSSVNYTLGGPVGTPNPNSVLVAINDLCQI